MRTLLLNASCEPLKIISWQRAVCMWLDGKVEIMEEYTEKVYKAMKDWSGKMPAVVRLVKYINNSRSRVKFSRINVFSRDFFACQYCGIQPGTEVLTYDHVMPRSRGGRTCWENIVTSCIECNSTKGDSTPAEAGMKLKSTPVKPKVRPFVRFDPTERSPTTPDAWRDYVYWNTELEK